VRNVLLVLFCALLAACASAPVAVRAPETLFADARFAAPKESVGVDEVLAVSEPMRRYLQRPDVAVQLYRKGPQRGLLEALYDTGELKLDYDASVTRTAAEAFAARAGNCLSLVVMTAAFARELGLQVRFQSAFLEETVSRSSGLILSSGHVNVTLVPHFAEKFGRRQESLTIDFLPPEEVKGLRTREISEETVLAMFMNNRAVEALVANRIDDAYAWARESIRRNPQFLPALNTLGVVYMRHGDLALAEAVFGRLLEYQADNRLALANLAGTLARQGRVEASAQVQRRLAALEPEPPLHYFNLGLAAMKRHDYGAARDLFAREMSRDGDYHELHYWIGLADYALGNLEQARQHISRALQTSASPGERAIYSAKLDWIRGQRQH
jgi:tetratricopeptide (TPR) repeat protein